MMCFKKKDLFQDYKNLLEEKGLSSSYLDELKKYINATIVFMTLYTSCKDSDFFSRFHFDKNGKFIGKDVFFKFDNLITQHIDVKKIIPLLSDEEREEIVMTQIISSMDEKYNNYSRRRIGSRVAFIYANERGLNLNLPLNYLLEDREDPNILKNVKNIMEIFGPNGLNKINEMNQKKIEKLLG